MRAAPQEAAEDLPMRIIQLVIDLTLRGLQTEDSKGEQTIQNALQFLLRAVELGEDLLQDCEIESGEGCRLSCLFDRQKHIAGDLVCDSIPKMPSLLGKQLVDRDQGLAEIAALGKEPLPILRTRRSLIG